VDIKESFKQYYKKLIIEAWIKSAIIGLFFGLLAGGVFSALALMFGFNFVGWTIAISIIVTVVVAAGATVLLYFNRYRPSFHEAAARVDQTGLEERMITMLELDGNETLIAQKQRDDGKQKISGVTPKQMKYKLPLYPLIAVGVALVIGVSIMVSAANSAASVQKKENELRISQQEDLETIERLISQLESLIMSSRVREDDKVMLLGRTKQLRVDVAKLPTPRQKMDKVRREIQEIRALLEALIAALDAEIAGLPIDSLDRAALQDRMEALQELFEALEPLDADGDQQEMEQGDGPPMPTVPMQSDMVAPDSEYVTEIFGPASNVNPGEDGSVYQGSQVFGNKPYNDPAVWQQAYDYYQERLKDPELSTEDKQRAEDYFEMLKAFAPEGWKP